MANPSTGKRFVALSAAVALGFGGALIAAPASATTDGEFRAAAAEAFTLSDNIAAIGFGEDGSVVAQVVADTAGAEVDSALTKANTFAKKTTGSEVVVQEVASTYSTQPLESSTQDAETLDYSAPDEIVAGAGYLSGTATLGFLCSVGFPATGPNGEDALITAGHCASEGDPVYMERPSTSNVFTDTYNTSEVDFDRQVGEFTHAQYGPVTIDEIKTEADLDPAQMQDFGVITVDESAGFELLGEVATWGESSGGKDDLASDTTPITGVHDVTTADIGKEVFHSGRTTGKTSGDIGWDESKGSVSIAGIVDGYAPIKDDDGNGYMVYGFASETPVAGGDSGGTVMLGDKAVGVVSGGFAAQGDLPAMLWTAELSEGLKHLPGSYEILTTEGAESPSPTPTDDPTEEPSEDPSTEPTTPAPTPTDGDDEDADQQLVVDPGEIAAERFVADGAEQAEEENRGVTYTVSDVEPGTEVVFDTYVSGSAESANAGSEALTASTQDEETPEKSITVVADDNGVALSRIWGQTSAAPEAYIGDYRVVATLEEKTLEGEFSVVAEASDPEGGQDGDGSEELPRTGSTVAPLIAAAAGLVTLGGASVYMARRRKA